MSDLQLKEIQSVFEVEQILISHILNGGKYSEDILLSLLPNDFGNKNHKIIYTTIMNFHQNATSYDTFSLLNFFENNEGKDFLECKQIIIELQDKFLYQENIKQYIDLIKSESINRQIKKLGNEMLTSNLDFMNSKDKLWDFENKFYEIHNSKKNKDVVAMSAIIEEYSKTFEQTKYISADGLTGLTSGYVSLDKITNGFQGGDLIILAARPGIGKTALAINFLVNGAKRLQEENEANAHNDEEKQKIVLMFSMEMGKLQICQRIVCQESNVELSVTKKGKLDSLQSGLIYDAMTNLSKLPLYIDDTSDLSIIDIQSKLKQLSSKNEIKLIVVDYLQLLKGAKTNMQINRQQEVATISRSLKGLARQYNVPIIAIAQLSRKIEERKSEGRKPMLSDLRESGAIEQDADLVCFINYKESMEEIVKKQDLNNVMVEFIIAKNRNGSIGSVDMLFCKPISKYYDAATSVVKK